MFFIRYSNGSPISTLFNSFGKSLPIVSLPLAGGGKLFSFVKTVLLLVCIQNVQGVLNAQDVFSGTHRIGKEDGLSNTLNAFLYKDRSGFVWIGSVDGLNRFDGKKIKVYRPNPLDSFSIFGANVQSAFFESKNGDIWFATESAINCYRRERGNFDHYFVFDGTYIKDSDYYAFALEKDRFLWIKVRDKLYKFDIQRPDAIDSSLPVCAMHAPRCAADTTPDGTVQRILGCFWHTDLGFETIVYKHGNVARRDTFFQKTNTWGIKAPMVVIKAVVDRDTAWLATTLGLVTFDMNLHQWSLCKATGIGSEGLIDIEPIGRQRLLLVQNSGRVLIFSKQSMQVVAAPPIKKSDPKQKIIAAILPNDNVLWYSVMNDGVYFSNLSTVDRFINPILDNQLSPVSIAHICADHEGNIWGLSDAGTLYVFDKLGNCIHQKQNTNQKILCSLPHKKEIWAIDGSGIIQYTGVNRLSKIVPIKNDFYYSMAVDQSGNKFLGTLRGLSLVSHDNTAFKDIRNISGTISFLLLDKGNNLWVGTDKNLQIWNKADEENRHLIHTVHNTGMINHLVEDRFRNAVWAATSKGVIKIDAKHNFNHTLIDSKSGIPNEYVYAIAIDTFHTLWLSTNQGIVHFDPDQNTFVSYTKRQGTSSTEYNKGAVTVGSQGEIWFGGLQGIDVVKPGYTTPIGAVPQMALTGIYVNNVEWRSNKIGVERLKTLELHYEQNTIGFEMSALEYTDPQMNTFSAFLEGHDKSWIDLGTKNFVTYNNLLPGRYTFKFMVASSEGKRVDKSRAYSLAVVIKPPYWQTWWFRSLVAAIFLGLGTTIYYRNKLQVQQIESAQRERLLEQERHELERKNLEAEKELALRRQRDRVSADMHDELGGGLVSIGAQSKRAQKFQPAPEVQGILARIGDIAYTLNRNMRNLSWATDPEMDNLASLLSRLRKEARDFFDDHALDARIDIPMEAPSVALSGEFRLHILRAVLEALNNIAKHAQATEASLSVTIDSHFQINLCDNGVGFDPSEKAGTSKGLRSMGKRMEALGGTIEWRRNADGKGMTVIMEVPLALP